MQLQFRIFFQREPPVNVVIFVYLPPYILLRALQINTYIFVHSTHLAIRQGANMFRMGIYLYWLRFCEHRRS